MSFQGPTDDPQFNLQHQKSDKNNYPASELNTGKEQ